MRQFDLNKLEIEQIQDPRLDECFIARQDPVNEVLEEAGFEEITDDEYEAAIYAIKGILKRANEMLRVRGVELEFCEADMVDFTSFVCITKDQTEAEFADRVLV